MEHLCHFDTNSLTNPVYDLIALNLGCSIGQYAVGSSLCSNCDSSCLTCLGGASDECTSCNLGKYLAQTGECLTCDADGMVLGSSGQCVELCGDGKNFGLVACDDGNKIDGDGCSSQCDIEIDWTCSGGSATGPDTCSYTLLDIERLEVTENNNLIVKFNRPVFIVGSLSSEDFHITIT